MPVCAPLAPSVQQPRRPALCRAGDTARLPVGHHLTCVAPLDQKLTTS
jgi:hypothetical protein